MNLTIDLQDAELIHQKLIQWVTNSSTFLSKKKVGRYQLDHNHAKLWTPELETFLKSYGFLIDKTYLEIYQRTIFSNWQKFLPENKQQYALHIPIEGCDNWVVEFVDNQTLPSFDKLGIKYGSNKTSSFTKHFGFRSLDDMFIMRTDRQWRRRHYDRPNYVYAKSLLVTLVSINT